MTNENLEALTELDLNDEELVFASMTAACGRCAGSYGCGATPN